MDSTNTIFIKDLDGKIVDANAAVERQYGWKRDELLGQSLKMLLPDEEHEEFDNRMTRCLRGEEVHGEESTRLTKDGQRLTVLVTHTLLTDEAGKPNGVASISDDITELKRTQHELQTLNESLEQRIAERTEKLRENEERTRAIVNTATDAIITIGEDGIMSAVNPAAEKMFGYAADEIIGQNVNILMPSPYREGHDQYLANYLKTGEAKIIGIGREMAGRRKDGSTFPIDVNVSKHHDGTQWLFTGIIRDITERKALQKQILDIAAEEDRRIGQDLHDGIGQELTGLGYVAQALADTVAKTEGRLLEEAGLVELRETAPKLADGIGQALSHVQTVSRGLVPVKLGPHGLRDALQGLAAQTDALPGMTCALKCEEPPELEDAATATHLYRIAQEAVSNALKHGHPEHILIALEATSEKLTMQIADDGAGFDPSAVPATGMGLKTMRYRAGLIGATFDIQPAERGGTLITCTVYQGGVTYSE
ncbi:Sensor protein FixL [Bremerella volcania]|uniref:Sensor protein FixL n=2 Tax=Bremerella volcania TaxID=2527984 RepID=A0A518C5Y0_9BACT|nr:Sensor protein FixL [Bremerella volcania]